MRNAVGRKQWRPSALPLSFHLALSKTDWETALHAYRIHPYRAPVVDTYDLLKTILYKTNLPLDLVRMKFEARVRMNVLSKKRAAEPVEWHTYWEALNQGDSKRISMALAGAKVISVPSQIAVAEACAVLLQSQNKHWHETLVDDVPFATITANNLLTVSARLGRWDVALEMLPHVKIGRGDATNLWRKHLVRHSWEVGLAFLSATPPRILPHSEVIPALLEKGCSLMMLSERLEQKRSLSDLSVLSPLIDAALREEDWEFARRCLDHLVDVGRISNKAHAVLTHQCNEYGDAAVLKRLRDAKVPMTGLTVEHLEEIRW